MILVPLSPHPALSIFVILYEGHHLGHSHVSPSTQEHSSELGSNKNHQTKAIRQSVL